MCLLPEESERGLHFSGIKSPHSKSRLPATGQEDIPQEVVSWKLSQKDIP